jgi:hypothetical protein
MASRRRKGARTASDTSPQEVRDQIVRGDLPLAPARAAALLAMGKFDLSEAAALRAFDAAFRLGRSFVGIEVGHDERV